MPLIKNLINLNGKSALVTGAAGFLGLAISETLAELGANLILVDLPEKNLIEKGNSIADKWGIDVLIEEIDLEILEDRKVLLNKVLKNSNSLEILVNNAAFIGASKLPGWSVPFEEQDVEIWPKVLELNLTSIFHICQGLYPLMKKTNTGSIVNIASIYGLYGPDWSLYKGVNMANPAAYAASKGGLIQLTRWMSTTMAPSVRVNAISPGGIFRDQPIEFFNKYISKTPLNRMASEEDLQGAIAYLATPLSSYVTGQILQVDGGWGVW